MRKNTSGILYAASYLFYPDEELLPNEGLHHTEISKMLAEFKVQYTLKNMNEKSEFSFGHNFLSIAVNGHKHAMNEYKDVYSTTIYNFYNMNLK